MSDPFIVKKLADALNVSVLNLTGFEEEKEENSEKEIVKPGKTLEGYSDPTATKAMDSVWMSKATAKENDIVDDKNGNLFFVLKQFNNDTALLFEVYITPITNHSNFVVVKNEADKSFYINLLRFKASGRFLKDYRKKFTVSTISRTVLESKFRNLLGYPVTVVTTEVKSNIADDISKIFKDSVDYYNEKNSTSFDCPKGLISLREAVDISKSMNVKLDDLTRDHTDDRVLDQIIEYENKIKELKAKIGMED